MANRRATAINRRVTQLNARPVDTGSLRGDVIAVLEGMSQRFHGVQTVPDPGGELAAYLLHQASADSLNQMTFVLRQAGRRSEIDPDTVTPRIARLPISSHPAHFIKAGDRPGG